MAFKKDFKGEAGSAQQMSVSGSSNSLSSFSSQNSSTANSGATTNKKTGARKRSTHGASKRGTNNSQEGYGNSLGNSRSRKSQIYLDDSHDFKALLKASKKPIDISHLATYNYEHEEEYDYIGGRYNHNNRGNNNRTAIKSNMKNKRKNIQTQIHLSGMSYINANYKFILNHKGDYKSQLLDPNLPIDIKDISRVIVKQHDYHCPICLADEFVAPRMVKCGHIFCYSCLLNMFDNVKNDKSKTNIANAHNPIISCPLCSEVIKERFIILPVLVEQVKEDEPKLASKQYANVTLMHRSNSKVYAQSVANFYRYKSYKGNIPWISHGCTPFDYKTYSPYISSTRLIMCDQSFLKSCYQKEIDDLMTQKLIDSHMYGDSGKYFDMAIDLINQKIADIDADLNANDSPNGPPKVDVSAFEDQMSSLSLNEVKLPSYNDGHYYYEYDGNSRIRYFLSPLDVTVINKLFGLPTDTSNASTNLASNILEYNPAFNLPLNLNLFIENINFDEGKVTPELVSKFPFLGNLPYGAELGFLEVDWRKFDDSFLPHDASNDETNSLQQQSIRTKEEQKEAVALSAYSTLLPYFLKKKLYKRSTDIKNKRANEERARVRGELRREKETLEIFTVDQQDDKVEEEFLIPNSSKKFNKNNSAHIDLVGDSPVLRGSNNFNVLTNIEKNYDYGSAANGDSLGAGGSTDGKNTSRQQMVTVKTSVWGTKVPVVIDPEEEAIRQEEAQQFEEMIQKAKMEAIQAGGSGKKGKKGRRAKMIPLPL